MKLRYSCQDRLSSVGTERNRYDPIIWPGLLDYKNIELLTEIGPLQAVSSDLGFQKTSDNR